MSLKRLVVIRENPVQRIGKQILRPRRNDAGIVEHLHVRSTLANVLIEQLVKFRRVAAFVDVDLADPLDIIRHVERVEHSASARSVTREVDAVLAESDVILITSIHVDVSFCYETESFERVESLSAKSLDKLLEVGELEDETPDSVGATRNGSGGHTRLYSVVSWESDHHF